jgi:hypothetical protein
VLIHLFGIKQWESCVHVSMQRFGGMQSE